MPDYNGYLDADQTIVNYAVREMGGTFAQTLQDDPSRMLRNWRKCRKNAQGTAIGTTLFGALAVVAGAFTGAGTLLIAGVAVAAGSGFLVKHHSEGAAACELESEILDSCRPILGFLVELERRGANPSDLVSLYDRIVRAASAKVNPLDVTDRAQLQAFFQAELEQSAILSNLSGSSHGLGATMKGKTQQPAAPALNDAPVEDGGKKSEQGQVSPNQFEPIAPPEIANIPIEDAPSLQPAGQPEPPASPDIADASAARHPTDDRFAWARDLLHFPAVLIWGAQGSGKTSFAAWLLRQRILSGHAARVFDPHASYGQWKGLKVIGSGMNFSACDIAMQDFIGKVKQEYQTRSKQPDYKPTRDTVLVDEFTQWAVNCPHSSDFFVTALSDIRKIQKGVIFISHDRSLAGLGGAKGFSQARDNGLAELHLYSVVDPVTGEPRPAMKGKLKIPGKAAIEVEISPAMNGSMDFTDLVAIENSATSTTSEQQDARAKLEELYRGNDAETFPKDAETFPDTPEISTEGGNFSTTPENAETQRESDFSAFEADAENFSFSDFQLGKAVFLAVKAEMENGKKKAEIVTEILECKGRKYKFGCAWFDALIKKYGELN